MSRITLRRAEHREFTAKERDTAWRFLRSMMDGLTEKDKIMWRGLWSAWSRMNEGDCCEIGVFVERYPPGHRRHMSIEGAVFEAQEQFVSNDAFRDFLKVGAGFVTWAGEEGSLVAVPRSTSYSDCDELEMRAFTAAMIEFLRTPRATSALWPGLTERAREEMIVGILRRFES